MAEDQDPAPQYHNPVTQPEHTWKWCLTLYPKKAGPPLHITCPSKRECYEHYDSLGQANLSPFFAWEITNQVV